MVSKSCSSTSKPCDSCTTASATVFCRADSAFLCRICDVKLHAAKPASRHGRVCLCEVCEQAPAAVTCKADAAALCFTCDRDIHSANPLARRHVRLPIVPFYDDGEEFFEEEAEAASWLLPDPNSKLDEESGTPEYKSADYLGEMDPDLDLVPGQQKAGHTEQKQQYSSDGVVPVQDNNEYGSGQHSGPDGDVFPTYNKVDYPGPKPFLYNYTSQSISQCDISSSSLEVGVVPNHNVTADETKTEVVPTRASGIDREARVLRYKEKRKNRKFEKTIRYASRKVYAETRPRIKGRFAKRSEFNVDSLIVPTF